MTTLRRYLPLAVFGLLVLILVPLKWEKGLWLNVFTQAAIYSIASLGVGLLYGRLGMVSLLNFALFGVGGWVALRLSHTHTMPMLVCVLIGGLAAAVIGTLVGLPALRVRGLYLAMITLMAASAFYVIINVVGFPDGGSGFNGRGGVYSRSKMRRPAFAKADPAYFRLCVAIGVIGAVLVMINLAGRPGRAWAMIRRSQAAAYASGVNITRYKSWAFALAGFLSGIAGGLSAGLTGVLNTLDYFPSASMLLFALTLSAGAYNLSGAVITGVLAKVLPALFKEWGVSADLANLIFGVLLMISLTSAPEGAAGALNGLWQLIRSKIFRRPAARATSATLEAPT